MPEDPLLEMCEALNKFMPHNVLAVLSAEIPPPNVLFSGGSRNIKVTIKDVDTGKGIPNIDLILSPSGRKRLTNSAGQADFENTGAGNCGIEATSASLVKAGYISQNNKGSITVLGGTTSGMSHTMSFKKAPSTMYVKVVDANTYMPVYGAKVAIGTGDYVTTDSDGKISVPGLYPETSYSITVVHPQYNYGQRIYAPSSKPASIVVFLKH